MTDAQVLIVGAGITGAALALMLADAGVPVVVLDRAPPPPLPQAQQPLELRVSAIHAAAAGLLERHGAWGLIPAGCRAPFGRIEVWDAGSTGRIGFDSADIGQAWLGYIVENRALVAALHARLRQLPAARLLAPADWDDFEVQPQRVCLRLRDGRELSARLLVGADGAASPLRLRAGIAAADTPFGHSALICHVATARAHEDTARQRFLPTGPLAFLPLADGRSSIVWSTAPAQAQRLAALPQDAFAQELADAFGQRLGAIGTVGERAVIPLRGLEAACYVGPRLALAGDAAHVVHPLAGLGANLGLGDAAQLAAQVLAALHAGRDPGQDGLLHAYQRRRRSQDLPVVRAIVGLQRLFGAGAPPLRALRGLGLRAVDRTAPLKRLLTTAACGLADGAFG